MTVEVYDGATGLTASDYFSRASYNIKTVMYISIYRIYFIYIE